MESIRQEIDSTEPLICETMGDMSITIREATEADLLPVLSLYRQLDLKDEGSLPLGRAQQLFSLIQSYPNYRIYVAMSEGGIVGTFALLIMDNLGHNGAPSGIVEDVVVREDWQGRGVGRQMMAYAMERCKEAECYKLVLSSNLKREAAHRFYESLGFKKHGYSFEIDLDS